MPTYEMLVACARDFGKLTPEQKKAFLRAVVSFRADLAKGRGFRNGLRVKKLQGYENLWESTWAPDGRATFQYGDPIKDGHQHVVWRRVGSHEVFRRP